MQNLPVHWYEGLFIRPHHFQAHDRYLADQLHAAGQWDNPFNYGLHAIRFSKEALANHQFELQNLKARLRDGTLIHIDAGDEPDRVELRDSLATGSKTADLAAAFEQESTVQVFVGVPKLKLGRANVGKSDSPGDARHVEHDQSVQDESWGGNDQDIQFRRLNVRLLLSTDDTSGYELLPLVRVKRASEGEAAPELDVTYIPPVVSVDAWPGLSQGIVRAIYDVIGQKIDVLSQQVISRGIGLDSHEPGDAERVLLLQQLNMAYARLAILAFTQGVHPLPVYTELCGILGQLSIFSPERRVSDIPAYDHDDLHRVFTEIRLRIEALINAVRDFAYEQRFFVGVGMGMQVTLEPKWFNSNWQWFIGVNKGELSHSECRNLLSAGQLDWKLGSSRQVEYLFKHRATGLQLTPVERPIRALPGRQDWVYYEVPRIESPAWTDVQETQTLAMRLKDSLIVNLDKLQGERNLVVSALGKKVGLQFALFAVPEEA